MSSVKQLLSNYVYDSLDDSKQSVEESLVSAVRVAKTNPTVARALPLVFAKTDFNVDKLLYLAVSGGLASEFGFFLELTGQLSSKDFSKYLFKLRAELDLNDKHFFTDVTGTFGKRVVMENTPDLAKEWRLFMNMGLDAFQSMYHKFA